MTMKVTYTNECGDPETYECTSLAISGPVHPENYGKVSYIVIDARSDWATTGHFEVSQ